MGCRRLRFPIPRFPFPHGRNARDRHHRHRRRRQVVGHRRADEPLPVVLPADAHRGDLGRSHPPPHRWCAAGRPHPHERAAQRAHLHAFDGDPPPARGDQRRAEGLHRLPEVAGLRPGDRGDRRHRPERFGDRRPGRLPHVRDDQRLRRGQPAGEDRHDRLRRADRAEQVRQARRRRCPARCAQAVEAQPRGVPDAGRRRAGVSHHRQPVQRPRRQLDVRQPVPPAARQAAAAGGEVDARHRHGAEGAARHGADPWQPRALPGRDRRTGPRHQSPHRDRSRDRQPRATLLERVEGSGRSGVAKGVGVVCLGRIAYHLPPRGRGRRAACGGRGGGRGLTLSPTPLP